MDSNVMRHILYGPECRFCNSPLSEVFVDLGKSPLSNSYLSKQDLNKAESFYPLKTFVCSSCFLVQLQEFEAPGSIFSNYSYFSSYSDSWLKHAQVYSKMAIDRFKLSKESMVIELASNDGYLLKNFVEQGIPCLGIEPAENVAEAAIELGIPTISKFFGKDLAYELLENDKKADLIIANNVLAHVPNINDFVAGIKIILKSTGVATLEFPHLLKLIEENQFDTIYHEHFSYLSFLTVVKIFGHYGLKIFDVDEIPTHGGSLRIYATHSENSEHQIRSSVNRLSEKEKKAGLDRVDTYLHFAKEVKRIKCDILDGLTELHGNNKIIVGYGAAAKGNTLLNYCGITNDMVDFVVDRNPNKVGKYLPGTGIPIRDVELVNEVQPDYLFILPWNLKDEIIEQNKFVRQWGGQFITPIPEFQIVK